jgi:hypothetical protein
MKLLMAVLAVLLTTPAFPAEEWQSLFNGKDLTGWKVNTQPEAFKVVNGVIRAHATRPYSHLFYVGTGSPETSAFKDFELEAIVRGETNSNSGIYIHTDIASGEGSRLTPSKGYEVQLNSTEKEKRKTGSLYAVVDLPKSPVDETQWFKVGIRVEGKHITVRINDKQVVDYTEPEDPKRPKGFEGRLLNPSGGQIALQAHDPESTFYFKEIRIRRLP